VKNENSGDTIYYTFNKKAILKIAGSSTRFANFEIKKEEWKEVFGLLLGGKDGDTIYVFDIMPLDHNFKMKDEKDIENEIFYINAISESIKKYKIVGWFFSRYSGMHKNEIEIKEMDLIFHNKFKKYFPKTGFLLYNHLKMVNTLRKGISSEKILGFKIFDLYNDSLIEVNWKCDYDLYLLRRYVDHLILNITEFLPRDNIKEKYLRIINKNKTNLDTQFQNILDHIKQKSQDINPEMDKLLLVSQISGLKNLCKSIKNGIDTRIELLDYVEFKEYKISEELKGELFNLCIKVDEIQEYIENFL